jgi:hypothetical protein
MRLGAKTVFSKPDANTLFRSYEAYRALNLEIETDRKNIRIKKPTHAHQKRDFKFPQSS